MSDIQRSENLRTDDIENRTDRRYSPINRNQPYFTAADFAMGIAVCAMIWGPLAAGAFVN